MYDHYYSGALYTRDENYGAAIIFLCIFGIAFTWVLYPISLMMIFKKMGIKKWKAYIPVYSSFCLYKKIWNPIFFIWQIFNISMCVILCNSTISNVFILMYWIIDFTKNYRLAKSFNKDICYAIGLYTLSHVFYTLLGFGKAEYIGKQATFH